MLISKGHKKGLTRTKTIDQLTLPVLYFLGPCIFEHRPFLRTLEKIRKQMHEEIRQNTSSGTGLNLVQNSNILVFFFNFSKTQANIIFRALTPRVKHRLKIECLHRRL